MVTKNMEAGLFAGRGQGLKLGAMVRPISVSPEHGAVEKFIVIVGIDILPNDFIMRIRGKLKKPALGAFTYQRVPVGQPLYPADEMGVVGSSHIALA